jgi:hypothetical protein
MEWSSEDVVSWATEKLNDDEIIITHFCGKSGSVRKAWFVILCSLGIIYEEAFPGKSALTLIALDLPLFQHLFIRMSLSTCSLCPNSQAFLFFHETLSSRRIFAPEWFFLLHDVWCKPALRLVIQIVHSWQSARLSSAFRSIASDSSYSVCFRPHSVNGWNRTHSEKVRCRRERRSPPKQ